MPTTTTRSWKDSVIIRDEIDRYHYDGKDFIDDGLIEGLLERAGGEDAAYIRSIIQKARAIETLLPEDTAALLKVRDPGLWDEIYDAAAKIKNTVYDNRVVTFAPLYCSNRA